MSGKNTRRSRLVKVDEAVYRKRLEFRLERPGRAILFPVIRPERDPSPCAVFRFTAFLFCQAWE